MTSFRNFKNEKPHDYLYVSSHLGIPCPLPYNSDMQSVFYTSTTARSRENQIFDCRDKHIIPNTEYLPASQAVVNGTSLHVETTQTESLPSTPPGLPAQQMDIVTAETIQRLRGMGFSNDVITSSLTNLQNAESPIVDVDSLIGRFLDLTRGSKPCAGQETPENRETILGTDLNTDGLGACAMPVHARAERVRNLKRENERLRARTSCKVCSQNVVGMIFLPCGHVSACTKCGARLRHCNTCGEFIRATANIFLS